MTTRELELRLVEEFRRTGSQEVFRAINHLQQYKRPPNSIKHIKEIIKQNT